jgi:ornithine carbamoyltransferase
MASTLKHFIDLESIPSKELNNILKTANKLKKGSTLVKQSKMLVGKDLAMIFEKSSTRTRVSFEVGISELGGNAVVMNSSDMQINKGETIGDTAKVLSRYVDAIMIRANSHETILELAKNSSIPVINALSDHSHPCQIMASVMTIVERIGKIKGAKLAWLGDENNVLNSYIQAAAIFGYELAIASPEELGFCDIEIKKARRKGAKISCTIDPKKAVKDADVVITDTWFSMGDGSDLNDAHRQQKINLLDGYQVTSSLMKLAKKGAIFTHCLPATRGLEVAADVIDSKASVVFDEAENRLHVQKAIMLWLMK